jgi:hypothetical protein
MQKKNINMDEKHIYLSLAKKVVNKFIITRYRLFSIYYVYYSKNINKEKNIQININESLLVRTINDN